MHLNCNNVQHPRNNKGLNLMSKLKRQDLEPDTRVGHCCGCHRDRALYKIPGIFRYRCGECFTLETGFHHHLEPREQLV